MSWSPDSRKIALTSLEADEDNADIWVVPASGGTAERVVDWPETEQFSPNWSPDGKKIAFVSTRTRTGGEGSVNIWVIPASGGEVKWLAEGWQPDWSPDGSGILFVQWDDIWTVPASGGTPTRLLETPEREFSPKWSPDGNRILFIRDISAYSEDIWIADVSGIEGLRKGFMQGWRDRMADVTGMRVLRREFIQRWNGIKAYMGKLQKFILSPPTTRKVPTTYPQAIYEERTIGPSTRRYVWIDDALWEKAKSRSEEEDVSVGAIMNWALRAYDVKASEAGCDDYIAKPFKPRDLLEKVEKFLGAKEVG